MHVSRLASLLLMSYLHQSSFPQYHPHVVGHHLIPEHDTEIHLILALQLHEHSQKHQAVHLLKMFLPVFFLVVVLLLHVTHHLFLPHMFPLISKPYLRALQLDENVFFHCRINLQIIPYFTSCIRLGLMLEHKLDSIYPFDYYHFHQR